MNERMCSRMHDLMIEALTGDSCLPNGDLAEHLLQCRECAHEWETLNRTLVRVQQLPTTPRPEGDPDLDRLWNALEPALTTDRQERPQVLLQPEPDLSRWIRLGQYSYLILLGFAVWAALHLGQPWFISTLELWQIPIPHPFLAEYGLFLLFFACGGFIAALAAPLLVSPGAPGPAGRNPFHRLFQALTGRTFSLLFC